MAQVSGGLGITGSMGNFSIYRMRGSDKLVLRQKGGASKQRIKKDPNFEQTRMNNNEWAGSALMARIMNNGLFAVKHLADHGYFGKLTAVCKAIQSDDGENQKGKRAVRLSQSPYKLEGFGYNKYNPFDTVLRHPLQYAVDRNAGKAVVQLPEIVPGLNLRNPLNQPFCRFVFALAAVADMVYSEGRKCYIPVSDRQYQTAVQHTEWCPAKEKQQPQELTLQIGNWQPEEGVSLVLAVGVEFGQPLGGGEIRFTKYGGAAKVLRVV